jgi:hypothetical protein
MARRSLELFTLALLGTILQSKSTGRERGSDGEFGWPLRAAKEGFTLPTPWLTAMVVLDVVARAQGSTISHGIWTGRERRGRRSHHDEKQRQRWLGLLG